MHGQITIEDLGQLRILEKGFTLSCSRFMRAYFKQDTDRMYIPLFEALNWSVALQDRLAVQTHRYWYRSYYYGYLVKALRFARNRVHHQWFNALKLTNESKVLPYSTNKILPLHDWIWRSMTELPKGRNNEGSSEYEFHLAMQPARETLQILQGIFGMAVDDLFLGFSVD